MVRWLCFVTPCVGVWIETGKKVDNRVASESHPAWVCGLKPQIDTANCSVALSHPAWVCGLKQLKKKMLLLNLKSHPAWVCGLKL